MSSLSAARRLRILGVLAVAAGGCDLGLAPEETAVYAGSFAGPLRAPLRDWVEKTLERLTLEQKAAQLVAVRASGSYPDADSPDARRLLEAVRDLQVGALVVFDAELGALPGLLNRLQGETRVPLLVAADLERGLAFRMRRGAVPLPYAMAIAASGSESAAHFSGRVAAREARAVGVHWALAPVADVNSNPRNPVINIRSFGEDPALVARLVAAFVRGARAGGLLTTAKHFPGHGDTSVDTHLSAATLQAGRARLNAVELEPFRASLLAGVDAVMLGHIAAPALDPSGLPATLSEPIANGLLRHELGFEGLVVTDAMDMAGVRPAWSGPAAVRAVSAGADVILLPPDAGAVVRALTEAVREGRLAEARLDASVRRVLRAKARLGLPQQRRIDPQGPAREVGQPEDVAQALEIAQASITLVRNRGGLLPLPSGRALSLLHLVLSSDARNPLIQGLPEADLRARGIEARTQFVGPGVGPERLDALATEAAAFTHVLVSAFVEVRGSKGTADMRPEQAGLVRRLVASGPPVIVISFGSPYLLEQFPQVPAYLCAYGAAESSQHAALGALFGEFPLRGRLPVTLPGLAALGYGLTFAPAGSRPVLNQGRELWGRGTRDQVHDSFRQAHEATAPLR